jgi:hypothetical protein
MKTNTEGAFQAQSVPNPPFLDSRTGVARPSPNTTGGRFVASRYGVDPALADLVADLAGLGCEVRP